MRIVMTAETTNKIAAFATDVRKSETLEALMDWYGVTSLAKVPESAALEFLAALERKCVDG